MMKKKALVACVHHWTSPFRLGGHHIARELVNLDYEVAFVSDPISPLHLGLGVTQDLRDRFEIYRRKGVDDCGGRLWAYVPGALITPTNKPLLNAEIVSRAWPRWTFPNVVSLMEQKGFGEVDLLCIDSLSQGFWVDMVKAKKSVYRVADKISAFDKYTTPAMVKMRLKLARSVDLVIFSAHNLEAYVAEMHPQQMLFVPNGVNFEHFVKGSRELPPEYASIPRPIAVYVGALDFWFDYELINYAAAKLPHISFVLIGHKELAREKLEARANVFLLGRRDYSELTKYLCNAAVGLIPFDVQRYPDLIHSVHPLKLYEYMACGLPVVSIAWQELARLKSPAILCNNREEFVQGIKKSVTTDVRKDDLINYASQADWSKRVRHLLEHLGL